MKGEFTWEVRWLESMKGNIFQGTGEELGKNQESLRSRKCWIEILEDQHDGICAGNDP